MDKISESILCGGTFFTLLLQTQRPQSPKKHGKKTDFTESDILKMLILLVETGFSVGNAHSFATAVSEYQSCKTDGGKRVPLSGVPAMEAFKIHFANEYPRLAGLMNEIVGNYVHTDEQRRIWLIRQLIELINTDDSILPDDKFYIRPNGEIVEKKDLCDESNICLSSFLLGVWHFIVLNRPKNKAGETTFNKWHEIPETSHTKPEFVSKIGEAILHEITLLPFVEPVQTEYHSHTVNAQNTPPSAHLLHTNQIFLPSVSTKTLFWLTLPPNP
jgi:hypothetical protein